MFVFLNFVLFVSFVVNFVFLVANSDHSYFQSGSSGCFRSHNGRRLRTSGGVPKLYAGGGEVGDHSSVHASHGSLPAGSPARSERHTLTTKHSTAAAWKMTPNEAIRLIISSPRPG